MNPLTTDDVAKAVDVHPITLERWLSQGKVKSPKRLHVGRRVVRLWTEADVKRIRKYRQENYRKGRGRKPKPKR